MADNVDPEDQEQKNEAKTYLDLNLFPSFAKENSNVKIRESRNKKQYVIENAWGDDTVTLVFDKDLDIESVFGSVRLPERFSAIWHKDKKLFEIIFTAYPLNEEDRDILDRKFTFRHKDIDHRCYFDNSSEQVIALGQAFRPSGPPTKSDYRNLFSYSRMHIPSDQVKDSPGFKKFLESFKPLSFWISNVEWNDDDVLDLVNHLNFYMSYYDTTSPIVEIHSPPSENVRTQPQTRFRFDEFPSVINSRHIDVNLLHFWQASRVGDPAKRFLYNYQILEYAAFYQLEESVSHGIKKLLAAPASLGNSDKVALQIIETLAESKLTDPQKLQWLFRRVVDCKLIWNEIALNKAAFTEPTHFDGGYTIQPIVKNHWQESDFSTNWTTFLPDTLRNIRNALSHGREARMSSVITPTTANFARLQYWVPLVDVAAREVMVYRNVL